MMRVDASRYRARPSHSSGHRGRPGGSRAFALRRGVRFQRALLIGEQAIGRSSRTLKACPTRERVFQLAARRGMSLLEVLISVAIFLGALTAIMQVLNVGQRAEVATRLQTEAILKCEAKMAEFISGIEEAASSQGGTFEDDEIGNWKWDAEVTDSGIVSLLLVTVKVEHTISDDEANAAFTLSRYMRDPQLFIDAALSETAE